MQKRNIQINRIKTTRLIPFEEYKHRIFEQTQINPDDENQMKYEKIKKLAELGKSIEQQVQNSLTHLNGFLGLGIKTELSFEFKRAIAELGRIQKLTADYSKIVVRAHEIAEGNDSEQSQITESMFTNDPQVSKAEDDAYHQIMKIQNDIRNKYKVSTYLVIKKSDNLDTSVVLDIGKSLSEGGPGSGPHEDDNDKEELKRSLDKHISRVRAQRKDISNKNFDRRPDSNWKLKGIQEISKPEPPESLEKGIPPKDYLKKLGVERIKKENIEYYTKCFNCGAEKIVKPGEATKCSKCGKMGITPKHQLTQDPKNRSFKVKSLKELKDYYGKSIKKGSHISWTDSKGVEHTGIVKDPSGILAKDEKSFQHIDVDPRNDTLKVLNESKSKQLQTLPKYRESGKKYIMSLNIPEVKRHQLLNYLNTTEFNDFLVDIIRSGKFTHSPEEHIIWNKLQNILENQFLKEYGSLLKSKYGFEGDILTEDIKAYNPKDAYLKLSKKNPAYEVVYLLEKNSLNEEKHKECYWCGRNVPTTEIKYVGRTGATGKNKVYLCKKCNNPETIKKLNVIVKEDLPSPKYGDQGSGFPLNPDKNELNETKGKYIIWRKGIQKGMTNEPIFGNKTPILDRSIAEKRLKELEVKYGKGKFYISKHHMTFENISEVSKFINPVKDAVGNMIWIRDRVLEKMFDPKSQKYVFPKKYSAEDTKKVEDIVSSNRILAKDFYSNKIMALDPREIMRVGKSHSIGYN